MSTSFAGFVVSLSKCEQIIQRVKQASVTGIRKPCIMTYIC